MSAAVLDAAISELARLKSLTTNGRVVKYLREGIDAFEAQARKLKQATAAAALPSPRPARPQAPRAPPELPPASSAVSTDPAPSESAKALTTSFASPVAPAVPDLASPPSAEASEAPAALLMPADPPVPSARLLQAAREPPVLRQALPEDDPLREEKLRALAAAGLSLETSFATPPGQMEDYQLRSTFDGMLEAARVVNMDEEEYYFLGPPTALPTCIPILSPRNEAAALTQLDSLLRRLLHGLPESSSSIPARMVEGALRQVAARCEEFGRSESGSEAVADGTPDDARLMQWAAEAGVRSSVGPAYFARGPGRLLRGARALRDMAAGECAVEVPARALITAATARASAFGAEALRCAQALQGDDEALCILWTIHERCLNPASPRAPFWRALPGRFCTALEWSERARRAAEGAGGLVREAAEAVEQLRVSYEALVPALTAARPDLFPAEIFTWERFLWAAQVWYTHTVQVELPSGDLLPCLVPVASLLNHSPRAHVQAPARVHGATGAVHFPLLRRCPAGSECLVAYGAVPNAHLALFDGFLVPSNPYDTVPIALSLDEGEEPAVLDRRRALLDITGVGLEHSLGRGEERRVPARLLVALRILHMDAAELAAAVRACEGGGSGSEDGLACGDPAMGAVSSMSELRVAEALVRTLEALRDAIPECRDGAPEQGGDGPCGAGGEEADLRDEDEAYCLQLACSYRASYSALLSEVLKDMQEYVELIEMMS